MENSRFINPYNFIPQVNGVERTEDTNSVKYSGSITCELTNKTPMIIVDPEKVRMEGDNHKVYSETVYLGDDQNTPAIPASEIRGMIRNKFETLTNSCMSNIDEEQSFTGRYHKFMKKAGLLDLSTDEPELYECECFSVKKSRAYNLNARYQTGDRVWFNGGNRDIQGLSKKHDNAHRNEGIVKVGEIFNNKQSMYIFFNKRKRVNSPNVKELKQKYKLLNELYQEKNDTDKNHPGYLPDNKGMVKPVWYEAIDNKIYISLSQRGRIIYDKQLKDLMVSDEYLPCKKEPLCEACRLFGMVNGKKKRNGKVRFTDALMNNKKRDIFLRKGFTLPALSSPNYSNPFFYFDLNTMKSPDAWNIDFYFIGKNRSLLKKGNIFIRGRKEYWHHMPDLSKKTDKSKLNSTVDVLKEGLSYTFKVYYEELTKQELEHLILSLSLGNDTDYCHKLGKGKPLGFGSVKVHVKDVQYYQYSYNEQSNKLEYIINTYKPSWKDMSYSAQELLEKVFNLKDQRQLKAIQHMYSFSFLGKGVKVTYPTENIPNEKGFEWFQRNMEAKPPKCLPFADHEYDALIQNGHKPKNKNRYQKSRKRGR